MLGKKYIMSFEINNLTILLSKKKKNILKLILFFILTWIFHFAVCS